ncbi:MAG TPA: septal ring lytic transglycosylase RlpA family protein [Myxococcales bacterium]|jgi:rare lipoprotein A
MLRAAPYLVCIFLFGLAGCTHAPRSGTGSDEPEEGGASFYSASLEGNPTASGEPYRGEALTCAHRTFAFGTRLEVTNLENGRSVEVVVNDRGPFVRGRVIDLSMKAARELGMVGRGVVRVRIRRLGR